MLSYFYSILQNPLAILFKTESVLYDYSCWHKSNIIPLDLYGIIDITTFAMGIPTILIVINEFWKNITSTMWIFCL